MTKTQAMKQARSESYLRRQGTGWIVGTYSPRFRATEESLQQPYFVARERLSEWRAMRAAELMGWDQLAVGDCGSLAERLAAAEGTLPDADLY